MKKLMNILVLITCIYSQIDVNISDCDEQEINNIPTLSANLKPEFQPSWDNAQFTDLLNELRIPSLRWPGAVGSNYFDWEKGRILPCYKWNTTPCSGDGKGSGTTQFGDFNGVSSP